jgi:hypothetical protein
LVHPRVYCDETARSLERLCEHSERRHRHNGAIDPERKPLDHSGSDTQPREGTGTLSVRKRIERDKSDACFGQHLVDHRQQPGRMPLRQTFPSTDDSAVHAERD